MNRKYLYAGAAVAAFAVPLIVAALPTLAQEAAPGDAPVVRPALPMIDRMLQMFANRDGDRVVIQPGPDLRGMIDMLQAQARGDDRRFQVRPPAGGPGGGGPLAQNRPGPVPQLRDRAPVPQRPAVNPLEQYDTNKDGATTQAEINDLRGNRLKQFDKNADNKLTLEEYTALWLDAYRRQMVDQFQKHDDDGDGMITIDEFNEDFANLVRRNDINGDGKVDATDARRPTTPAGTPGTPTVVPVPTPGTPTTRGI